MSEILGFDADHISRLTSLSKGQLRYWNKTGFYSPSLDYSRPGYGPIYSFRDVVALKTIATLRGEVPLQELRRVGEWLKRLHTTPWSSLRFALADRNVIFFDPDTGKPTEAVTGQNIISIEMEPIARDVRDAAERLRDRSEQVGQISRRQRVIRNAAAVSGTRIRTEAIWNFHQAGYNAAAIVQEYPRLKREDVRAAIEYEENQRTAAA